MKEHSREPNIGGVPEARFHPQEEDRLSTLRGCALLDTEPEAGYDDAVRLAALLCDTPIALVSLVDECRQWFKAKVGVDLPETPRKISFCAHAVVEESTVVVEDARTDARFSDNELVTGDFGLVHYAGAVVRAPNGMPLGTVCVADFRPRQLTPSQIGGLEAIARQVGALIASRQDCSLLERYAVELSEARLHLEMQTSQLEDANEKLAQLATTDPLTGIPNRRAFMDRLERELTRCTPQKPLALLMLDIDDFKGYNDTFGHGEGDIVLRQVADIISRLLRPGDLVARYGGEEFCVLLPGATEQAGHSVSERIRVGIAHTPWPFRSITVSLGVTATSNRTRNADTLFNDADTALYASKRGGRNRTTVAQLTAKA